MKKYILCALFGGCFLLSAYSLEISGGPYLGFGFNHSLLEKNGSSAREKISLGFHGGGAFDFRFSDYFSLQADVNVSYSASNLDGTAPFFINNIFYSNDSYFWSTGVNLLLKPQYLLIKEKSGKTFVSLYALVGGGLGLVLTGKMINYTTLNGIALPPVPLLPGVTPAVVFGLGSDIKIGKGFFFTDARYTVNYTRNIYKTSAIPRNFVNQFRINIGYRFLF